MIADQSKITIGGIEYRTHTHSTGPDKRQILEAEGKHSTGHRNLLLIEQFGDTRIKDLPPGLDISLGHPNTPLGMFENFSLFCHPKRGDFSFTLFYAYEKWDQPKSLRHYVKELSGKLLAELAETKSASIGQDQGCVWIDVQSEIPIQTEVREYIITLEKRVQSISSKIDTRREEQKNDHPRPDLKPDEKGLKWWLRYIIVPILGSAGLIGVIKLLAEQA